MAETAPGRFRNPPRAFPGAPAKSVVFAGETHVSFHVREDAHRVVSALSAPAVVGLPAAAAGGEGVGFVAGGAGELGGDGGGAAGGELF
jgi:hypothetical protein